MSYCKTYKPITKQSKLKNAKPDRKKLEKECLKLWQEIVKIRAGNKCEFPGCNKSDYLNAHHFFRRSHKSVLVDSSNGLCLCPNHHTLGQESAHHDPAFTDKILGRIPGYKAVRTEDWYQLLTRKAWTPYKPDWNMELIYLKKELDELRAKIRKQSNSVQ